MRVFRGMAVAAAAALAAPASALGHAAINPPVSLSGKLQLYTLVVPTEKETAATTKVELTVPPGFSIDSFAPSPGWRRLVGQTGSGESAVIQTVTWSGGHVPGGEDSVFEFLAGPSSHRTYRFTVRQTYSDGSIASWSGPESSEFPAPTIEVRSSLGGGGGRSTLEVIALIAGLAGLLLGGLALYAAAGDPREGRRPLA